MDKFNDIATSDEESSIDEKMSIFSVELDKGKDNFGLNFQGECIGTDSEKLGIFIKSITKGGSADKNGSIQIEDQIIEVNNISLVGVSRKYASHVLGNTHGIVHFIIGRRKSSEDSTSKETQ